MVQNLRLIKIVSIASFVISPWNAYSSHCPRTAEYMLKTHEALEWANGPGAQYLDFEFINKLSEKLALGSKDLQKTLELWGLQTRFSLLQTALQKTSLNDLEISKMLDVPLKQVLFWRDRPYHYVSGQIQM
jgi:hypothetical protein